MEALDLFLKDTTNNLFQAKIIDNVNIKVGYKPQNKIARQIASNEQEYDSLSNKLSIFYYFTISISKDNKDLESFYLNTGYDYTKSLEILTFGIKNYLSIISYNGDTIIPIECHYTRLYGGSPTSNFLVIFSNKKIENQNSFKLCIADLGLGIGKNCFKFSNNDIEKVPELEY